MTRANHPGKPPTDRQRMVLLFVLAHHREHGYGPTLRELCKALHFASTNAANDHRRLLVRKGLLQPPCGTRARTGFLLTPAGILAATGDDETVQPRAPSARLPRLPGDLAAANEEHAPSMRALQGGQVCWMREGGAVMLGRLEAVRP